MATMSPTSPAIEEAQAQTTRPSLLLVHTHIGYGSPKKQDSFDAHGSPLGEDELAAAKKALGWPTMDKFFLPQDAVEHFRQPRQRRRKRSRLAEKFDSLQTSVPRRSRRIRTDS